MGNRIAVHRPRREIYAAGKRCIRGKFSGPIGKLLATEAAGGEEIAAKMNPELTLHGNEIVILMVRPSLWYIFAGSFRFNAIFVLLALLIYHTQLLATYIRATALAEITTILVLIRLVYAMMDWTSQVYLLTNCRVVTIKGLLHPELYQVSLPKISQTRLMRSVVQQLFKVGSIGFVVTDQIEPEGIWEWISHPDRVQQQIEAALKKRGGNT
ncbi:MAG TPA: PH domain-containing protein [Phycisphaerae bacterium]|nr:PH domain-containing protein [Phycisphaerae bacterium]